MKGLFSILIIAFLTASYACSAAGNPFSKETYKGKISTVLGVFEGEFSMNLNGENTGMVQIKLIEVQEKSKGERKRQTEMVSVNIAGVRSIEIEEVVYILKSIVLPDGKKYNNCCMCVTDSSSVAVLAYWGTAKDADKCFVMTKYNTAFLSLKHIRYYTFSKLFEDCPSIFEKTKQESSSAPVTFNSLSQEALLTLWRSRMSEYNNCNK